MGQYTFSRADECCDPDSLRRLLRGVVFAISGLENPERTEVREMTLAMGAEYRPTWGLDCTLLLAVFFNAPKVRQAMAAGATVIHKDWIHVSHAARSLVPAGPFLMHAGLPLTQPGPQRPPGGPEEQKSGDAAEAPCSPQPQTGIPHAGAPKPEGGVSPATAAGAGETAAAAVASGGQGKREAEEVPRVGPRGQCSDSKSSYPCSAKRVKVEAEGQAVGESSCSWEVGQAGLGQRKVKVEVGVVAGDLFHEDCRMGPEQK